LQTQQFVKIAGNSMLMARDNWWLVNNAEDAIGKGIWIQVEMENCLQ
jgi:hypothetical protein